MEKLRFKLDWGPTARKLGSQDSWEMSCLPQDSGSEAPLGEPSSPLPPPPRVEAGLPLEPPPPPGAFVSPGTAQATQSGEHLPM